MANNTFSTTEIDDDGSSFSFDSSRFCRKMSNRPLHTLYSIYPFCLFLFTLFLTINLIRNWSYVINKNKHGNNNSGETQHTIDHRILSLIVLIIWTLGIFFKFCQSMMCTERDYIARHNLNIIFGVFAFLG